MFNRIQHTIVGLLLTSYLFVGALAHLEPMGRLFQYDSKPQKVYERKPATPSPEMVYWTQYKHIPSFTKIVSFSPAFVAACEPPPLERFFSLLALKNTEADPFLFTACTSSRAPPLAILTA